VRREALHSSVNFSALPGKPLRMQLGQQEKARLTVLFLFMPRVFHDYQALIPFFQG